MTAPEARVLLIDDELQIRRILRLTLESNGFTVVEAATGKEGVYLAAVEHPDIVLLDLGLPDTDGVAVLKQIREWSAVPVIILSVRSDENGKVAALEAGADDYITKPFGIKELIARLRVALRHRGKEEGELREFHNGALVIDFVNYRVTIGGAETKLTATEFNLLALFAKNAGKLLTHNHIVKELWGAYAAGGSQKLRVHIAQLRKKIETDPGRPFIVTETGVGYRMKLWENEE
jgi:two-component system KDP operon response regulator KdpE